MSKICNVVTTEPPSLAGGSALSSWQRVYLDSDKLIASGSAYFAQAFADVLGLVADEELNDRARARLRLGSIRSLLKRAIREYEAAADFDSRTGLDEYHQDALRGAGLDEEGTVPALHDAAKAGLVPRNSELFEGMAATFVEKGFAALMHSYVDRLRDIHGLLQPNAAESGSESRDLTWVLLTRFTEALQVGQAIAVLNSKADSGLKATAT